MTEVKGFDYGTDNVQEVLNNFKIAEPGDHSARLAGIIHLGTFRESYNGELKKPAHQVLAIFELKDDEDFEEDGETPLYIHKSFPLKKGDKTFMNKMIRALDPKGKAEGFDDMIGAACTVSIVPSKQVDSEGKPKYTNFGGLSGLPAQFAKHVPKLVNEVGHVRPGEITKDNILMMNPIIEVANILMKTEEFKGSEAESIIKEIRKDNPDFAKPSSKKEDENDAPPPTDADDKAQPEVDPGLDEEAEY